jgi:hypothetical protein
MNKSLLVALGIAVLVVAAVIGGVFFIQRGAHLELQGRILKVRTAPLDENSSVAVLDFRFTNIADYPFTVRNVTVAMEDSGGNRIEGTAIAETDAQRLFEAIPLLGQKYNASLIVRDVIPGRASEDRMIAVRFDIPEAQLEKRRQVTIQIEDVAGPVSTSEIKEK